MLSNNFRKFDCKWALIASIVSYIILISLLSFIRLYDYRSGAFDLGVFVQALSSALHGRFFYEAPDFEIYGVQNFFGIHFSPILFLVLPIYALFSYPTTLLIFQSIIVAAAALFLYKIANMLTNKKKISLVIALIYLVNPIIISANLYDYHVESFIPLLFFGLYYYYLKRSKLYFLFMVLFAMVVEATIVILSFFSIYALLKNKQAGKPFFSRENRMFMISLGFSLVLIPVAIFIMNHFGVTPTAISGGSTGLSGYLMSISHFLFASGLNINDYSKVVFWLISLGTLAFLPILSPLELIPAIPYILVSILSSYTPFYTIGWQYGFYYMPILFVATIYSIKEIHLNKRTLISILSVLIIIALALNPAFLNLRTGNTVPPSGGYNVSLNLPEALTNYQYLNKIVSLIPNNATILSSFTSFPLVANDINAYTAGVASQRIPSTQYLLVDSDGSYTGRALSYGVIAEADNIILLKDNYSGGVMYYVPFSKYLQATEFDILQGLQYVKLHNDNGSVVLFPNTFADGSTLWYGPYTGLTQGIYKATFYLKFDNISSSGGSITLDVSGADGALILSSYNVYYGNYTEGQWQEVNLIFSVNSPIINGIEFRGVNAYNSADIYFGGVQLQQISPYRSVFYSPASLDTGQGTLLYTGSGVYMSTNSSIPAGSTIWYGPYTSLTEGNYTANFIIKESNVSAFYQQLITLDVTYNYGRNVLSTYNLVTSPTYLNRYIIIHLTFNINTTSLAGIEFRGVGYNPIGDLKLAGVIVSPSIDNYSINYFSSLINATVVDS